VENAPGADRLGPRVARRRPPLSGPRAAVLDAVRDQPEPVSLAALVRLTGRHENTVREHLNALVAQGLVSRTAARTPHRGRPSWRYQCLEADPEQAEYAGLAAALARLIVRQADGPEQLARHAVEAGEEWGRELVRARDGAGAGAGELVRILEELRFEPEVDPVTRVDVRLRRCPLLETAYRQTKVVCAVHLGLARGALAELGEDPAGTELVPFAEPGACLLVLPQLAA
jgi:predicted ArsR family transcriptional regulator